MKRIPQSTRKETLGHKKLTLARIKLVRIRGPRPPQQRDVQKQVLSQPHTS
jgi:hypothetical protein